MMRYAFTLGIALLLSGCNVKIKTLYDHRVDFSQYKTFCWMKGCEFVYTGPDYLLTPEVKSMFQKSIMEEMGSKGIRYDNDNPELLVDLHITVADEKVMVYPHDENEEGFKRFYFPNEQPKEILLYKGTLIIDVAEKKSGRMIWRSVATSYMDVHPEIDEKNIKRGVRRALKDFPPAKPAASGKSPA